MIISNFLSAAKKKEVGDVEAQPESFQLLRGSNNPYENGLSRSLSPLKLGYRSSQRELDRITSSLAGSSISLPKSRIIQIRVGTGPSTSIFRIDTLQLCAQSTRFERDLRTRHILEYSLTSTTPAIFELFKHWLEQADDAIIYTPGVYSDEPWRSSAAQAWLLGEYLGSDMFMHYALSQFVLNCALADLETWRMIEKEAIKGTDLRKFSDHWVAWNASLGQSELFKLEASSLAHKITPDTRDPRTYNLDHWHMRCGADLGATCEHNVSVRHRMHEKAKPVYSLEGRDWELKNQQAAQISTNDPPLLLPTRSQSPRRSYVRASSPTPSSIFASWDFDPTRWWLLGFCMLFLVLTLAFSISLRKYTGQGLSIKASTVSYALGLNVVAAMFYIAHGVITCKDISLTFWYVIVDGALCLLLFALGIATAKESYDCQHAQFDSGFGMKPCHLMGALSAFTWFQLALFTIHVLWRHVTDI